MGNWRKDKGGILYGREAFGKSDPWKGKKNGEKVRIVEPQMCGQELGDKRTIESRHLFFYLAPRGNRRRRGRDPEQKISKEEK